MIERKFVDSNITTSFFKKYEELSNDDFKIHKQLIKEGVNPSKIAKIIRNDEVEKLQEISSQSNFDFNQKIESSLYERCNFINKENVTLIDYAAFFSSVKCFKYLLVNGSKIDNAGKYAVAGGNEEIIYLCEQNHSSFEDAYKTAIQFHKNKIFLYLYDNNFENIEQDKLICFCINSGNYEILSFLEKEGLESDDDLSESARTGNLYLVEHFLHKKKFPKDIIFKTVESQNLELIQYILFQQGIDINAKDKICFNNLVFQNNIWKLFKSFNTALICASKNGNTEIVKLLLVQKGIDINIKNTYLLYLNFIYIILYFKILFGNNLKYLRWHLCKHLCLVKLK